MCTSAPCSPPPASPAALPHTGLALGRPQCCPCARRLLAPRPLALLRLLPLLPAILYYFLLLLCFQHCSCCSLLLLHPHARRSSPIVLSARGPCCCCCPLAAAPPPTSLAAPSLGLAPASPLPQLHRSLPPRPAVPRRLRLPGSPCSPRSPSLAAAGPAGAIAAGAGPQRPRAPFPSGSSSRGARRVLSPAPGSPPYLASGPMAKEPHALEIRSKNIYK
ncbi:hypothetical protein VPH35_044598 [Triticum aestivum]